METKNSQFTIQKVWRIIQNSKFKIQNWTTLFILLFALQIEATPFTDNGDGTVKDNATGLIWQKCSQGQGATDCSGRATTATWANALTYCNTTLSLAGKTWRLPTINELKTIVDTTKASGAAIDTTAFPATVASLYWSSTTNASYTTSAWLVFFGDGVVVSRESVDSPTSKTDINYVRCVSGP